MVDEQCFHQQNSEFAPFCAGSCAVHCDTGASSNAFIVHRTNGPASFSKGRWRIVTMRGAGQIQVLGARDSCRIWLHDACFFSRLQSGQESIRCRTRLERNRLSSNFEVLFTLPYKICLLILLKTLQKLTAQTKLASDGAQLGSTA